MDSGPQRHRTENEMVQYSGYAILLQLYCTKFIYLGSKDPNKYQVVLRSDRSSTAVTFSVLAFLRFSLFFYFSTNDK